MNRARPPADVIVIGAGPAGLAAAAAAAESGRRVVLLDQAARSGGQIWRHRDEASLSSAARALIARVRRAGVFVVPHASVIDALSPQQLVVDFAGRADIIETHAIVVATGARERFIPFPGWTLPGVTGVGGLQALLKGGVDLTGKRVVLAGTGPLLFAVAAAIARAGGRIVVVAEQAARRDVTRFARHALRRPARLLDAMRFRASFLGTPYLTDSWVTHASGTGVLQAIVMRTPEGVVEHRCDWLGCAAGLVPVTDVAQLLGCAVSARGIAVDECQRTSVEGVWAAGECTGIKGDQPARAEGTIAGRSAAGDDAAARDGSLQRARDAGRAFGNLLEQAFAPRDELLALADDDTIICRCEDVRRGAVDPAWSQRQAKLWTRVGMGACQGAVCGPACTALFGWDGNAVRAPLGAPRCGEWADSLRS